MGNRFSFFLSEHKSFARPRGRVLGCSKTVRREGEDERERRVGQADTDAALA